MSHGCPSVRAVLPYWSEKIEYGYYRWTLRLDFLDNRDTALNLITAWLSDIPRVFGARARFEALRDLAREGISPDVLPLALDVVATALDGAPQLQAYAIWELAADANERDQVCALLKLAYGYTQRVWCDDNLHNI